MTSYEDRQRLQHLDRAALERHQLVRLNSVLNVILPDNQLYREKLGSDSVQLDSLSQLAELPLTTKSDLEDANGEGWATNRTFALREYSRYHQTSGTAGRPLIVTDTQDDWQWWIDSWQYVLDAGGITADDVCMMAFSFGPFIGFWSAFDAVVHRGCLAVPGGGLSTLARLERMKTARATCLFCTPTYAMRLAEVAGEHNFDLQALDVRTLIVAGEPGGSLAAVRARLESAWDAQVLDHSGATEIGPWGYGTFDGHGLFVNEAEFIAEFLDPETQQPASPREVAELILTTLGRSGCPVIRYRTGDLVRPRRDHDASFVLLEGGILGRADDMMIIRGVNIFPSSIEEIVRNFPEIGEYRLTAFRAGTMDGIRLEIEDGQGVLKRLAEEVRVQLGLNIEVASVPRDSLPRFEAKSRRFVDRRQEP